jgi:hypothetical protein
MISDGIVALAERGVITGARKTIDRGKIVAGECMGGPDLYRWAHQNPMLHMDSSAYIHDPDIIREIERGVRSVTPRRPYRLQPDRERAIAAALAEAQSGDAVLIAGKGHEREQIIGAARRPFDDREQARQALLALASRGAAEAGR